MKDAQALPNHAERETAELVDLVRREAVAYLERLDQEPARGRGTEAALEALERPLPEDGEGAIPTLHALIRAGNAASVRSVGPRFFHFVIGGVTPAALAADWWTAVLDQNAYNPVSSPLAAKLEELSVRWLKDLLGLPDAWGGVLTTGGTMANFVGLAAARQWWGERHGVNVAEVGLAGLPAPRVFSSDRMHPSVGKALAMLGMGRSGITVIPRDASGGLDLTGLADGLRKSESPSVVVANAGEPNAGDFDPIDRMADVARERGAWLHVDAAFGIFARVTPRCAHLTNGIERADSVAADGHKWLNVPHDCGFGFVQDASWLSKVFGAAAAYIATTEDGQVEYGNLGPEMSRRARSIVVWSTLHAYGRRGYRALVERCLDLAGHLAALVDRAPDLERLADVKLNVVCFRYRPLRGTDSELDDLNRLLSDALMADGTFYVGTTLFRGRRALRAVIINWRTTERDLEAVVDTIRKLGAQLSTG